MTDEYNGESLWRVAFVYAGNSWISNRSSGITRRCKDHSFPSSGICTLRRAKPSQFRRRLQWKENYLQFGWWLD